MEGITEDDIANLDDFQCYVKLSLRGHRLPVFSLDLAAPASPDEDLARLVRLRSQERNGHLVGVVDEQIRHIQARQKNAVPTMQQAARGRAEVETGVGHSRSDEEAGGARRHKKRGGSNRTKQQQGVGPSHMHLMYHEGDEPESSREAENEEQGRDNG